MSDNILEKKVDSYDHLLEETNDLLVRVGISSKKISSIEELSRVSSSMFVAVYESLFRTRLEGINRNPQTKEEYTSNVQIVIDELSDQIQIDLKHINGEDIANGDVRTISNLLRIFARIFNVTSVDGNNNATNDENSNSLSTHESDFKDGFPSDKIHHRDVSLVDGSDNLSSIKLGFKGADQLTISSIGPGDEVKQLIDMKKKHAAIDLKQEAARSRRQSLQLRRDQEKLRQSLSKDIATNKIIQSRWLEDQWREQNAANMKDRSQYQNQLRKFYVDLVKSMRDQDLERENESRQRITLVEDNLKLRLQSMEAVLQERHSIFKERELQRQKEEAQEKLAHRKMMVEIKKSLIEKFDQKKDEKLRRNLKRREKETMKRDQSYQDMLAMMGATQNWENSLRKSYPTASIIHHKKGVNVISANKLSRSPIRAMTGRHGFRVSPAIRTRSYSAKI